MAVSLDQVFADAQQLSPDQQIQLRNRLDELLAKSSQKMTEEEFENVIEFRQWRKPQKQSMSANSVGTNRQNGLENAPIAANGILLRKNALPLFHPTQPEAVSN